MALLDSIIGPISQLLDRIIPDPRARDSAKLELLKLQGDQEMASLATQMQAIVAERGGSVYLNRLARLLSGASAGFMPLREAVG